MSQEQHNQPILPGIQKTYTVGDVSNATVVQGEYNSVITTLSTSLPDGNELAQKFNELKEKIEKSPDFVDQDTRDLALMKTKDVAEALTKVQKSPQGLKRALLDAEGWFRSQAGWVWHELNKILKTEAVQKTIDTIKDEAIRIAIKTLIGVP